RTSAIGLLHLCIALCVSSPIASSPLADQQPATRPIEPARMALVIRFADGRTTAELVSARGAWMWTPKFPRIASPEPNAQTTLPVSALQVSRKLVGEDVHVDVSLLLKGTDPPRQVESTIVRRGQSVAIDALRQYGIEPIVLSVVDVAPVVTDLPSLVSVAPELVFEHADIVMSPYPGYRVTVRNVAQQAVALIHLQTYRGGREAMSRLNGGDDGRPLVDDCGESGLRGSRAAAGRTRRAPEAEGRRTGYTSAVHARKRRPIRFASHTRLD
ncbi:MAG: hypothetical protein ABMA15_13805, partial [Vicinamibacterales bacterium]